MPAPWVLRNPPRSHPDPRSWPSPAHSAPDLLEGPRGGAGQACSEDGRHPCQPPFDPLTSGGGTSGGSVFSTEVEADLMTPRPPAQPAGRHVSTNFSSLPQFMHGFKARVFFIPCF